MKERETYIKYLAVLVLILVGCILSYWAVGHASRRPATNASVGSDVLVGGPQETRSLTEAIDTGDALHTHAASALAEENKPPSARQFIRDFLGSEAQLTIERLEAMGWDLDKLGPPPVPLGEARAKAFDNYMPSDERIRAIRMTVARWPTELTAQWLEEHFLIGSQVTPDQFKAVQDAARPYLDEAQAIADQYTELLQYYVKGAWDRGMDKAFPFMSSNSTSSGPYCGSGAYGGWVFSVCLSWDDCPGLLDLDQSAALLAQQRDQTLQALLTRK
ncbi:MAG: hypothetical protein HZA53_03155 [Planctomycetes bacterium]|nr:hypothetical protein [Planctomycetota bacterium]